MTEIRVARVRASLIQAAVAHYALSLIIPVGIAAQSGDAGAAIVGQVVDAVTLGPIASVLVRHQSGGPSVLTDGDGRFRLLRNIEGDDWFVFERLGYRERAVRASGTENGEVLTVVLEPVPLELQGLEVFVANVRERFVRRRNASAGVVQALELGDMLELGAVDGYDLFLKTVRTATPCPGRASDYCLRVGGGARPITVCIDDRRAWRGVDELGDYLPHELYLVEIYQHGLFIRAYTQKWLKSGLQRMQLPPLHWGCR